MRARCHVWGRRLSKQSSCCNMGASAPCTPSSGTRSTPTTIPRLPDPDVSTVWPPMTHRAPQQRALHGLGPQAS